MLILCDCLFYIIMNKQLAIPAKEVFHFLNEAFDQYDNSDDYLTFPDFLKTKYNIEITNNSPISWYDEHLIFSNKFQYNWFLLQWK